ncbi:unnamed protein product [Lymnaea stagnalis]|uniref:Peptidase S54 rhomboid domain-containing protein n=1 Tax=Lymnaea stagnalis TaxID=6523 RepID=A0AAV2GXU1_LYMST
MIPLETCAGWHRVFIIYGISSMAGEAVASIVEPDLPHVGSTSGVGGILGVAVLELLQAWKFIRYPFWEGIKLSVLISMQIFLGTLQLVNLFSFFAGLGVGMMSCLMIVPYITFGRTLSHLRFRLVMLGFCLLVPTLILIQLTFKFIQEIRQCPNCVALECIPYTSIMCKTYKYWN